MKRAADFRRIARNSLSGKWPTAILTGFLATLIGATAGGGSPSFGGGGGSSYSSDTPTYGDDYGYSDSYTDGFDYDDYYDYYYDYSDGYVYGDNIQSSAFADNGSSLSESLGELASGPLFAVLMIIFLIILAVLAIWGIATFVIGGAGRLGYAKFNLNLVDQKPVSTSDLFSQFNRLGAGFCMKFFIGIFTFLWLLLFIVPGIVKIYSYSMTPYILYEHPEMSANQAITASRRLMDGNKGRLFCLNLSFIGWSLLCFVPALVLCPLCFLGAGGIILWAILSFASLFVGGLFLLPYREAAHAAFYRDISGTDLQMTASFEGDTSEFY